MRSAESRAVEFRKNAAECAKQKKRARDLEAKASWEELERQWLKLADDRESQKPNGR